jgi:hypothetical protein
VLDGVQRVHVDPRSNGVATPRRADRACEVCDRLGLAGAGRRAISCSCASWVPRTVDTANSISGARMAPPVHQYYSRSQAALNNALALS